MKHFLLIYLSCFVARHNLIVLSYCFSILSQVTRNSLASAYFDHMCQLAVSYYKYTISVRVKKIFVFNFISMPRLELQKSLEKEITPDNI